MSSELRENYEERCYVTEKKEFDASKWGTRHNQCILLFFTFTVAVSMRSCMGVALVAMTHRDTHESKGNVSVANLTIGKNITESTTDEFEVNGFFNSLLLSPPYPKFEWTKKQQDTVISGFYWGYMTLKIPAGQLAYKFGTRFLLFGALFSNCILSLMFPVAVYYGGWTLAIMCRVVQGLCQACILPSFHTILGNWSPVEERGRMSGIIYRGQSLGIVLGLPITGFIASSPLGWPGIFRFYGTLSGIVAIILWFYLADCPAYHKTISVAERIYIEESLGQRKPKKKMPVPWKSILTDRGMIAIVIAHISMSCGQVFMYSEVPAFMDEVMGVNIKANGLLTAFPFVMMFFTYFFFSWFTDMLVVKKYLNVAQTRKLATTIGSLIPAIGFIALAFVPKNIYIVESIFVVMGIFKIASHLGFYINHIDIAPNFAGVMISISSFASNCAASFAPIATGFVLTDASDEYLWRKLFFIGSGIYFFANITYVVLARGEVADWNDAAYYEKASIKNNLDIEEIVSLRKDDEEKKKTGE